MPRYGRDGPRTRINNIVVTAYQKRRTPSKHYVFIIDVTWDNDERYEVFRRYSEFFSLQETLTAAFSNFNLPNLPKRILLGRSHVKRVAEARLEAINLYCQSLVRLDEIVAESKHVTGFFSPKIGDQKLGKLRLHRPASLHPMKKPAGNVFEEHCVIAAFEGEGPSQISAESGDQVLVLNKDKSGWWLIERKKKVGWIPSSYLKKSNLENKEGDVLGLVEDYVDKSKQQNDTSSDSRKRSSTIATAFMGVIAGEGLELDLQEYKAIDSYEAEETSQLSFETGEVIMVLDKMEDGWWFASKGEEEGWVPCGYLEPISTDSHEEDNEQMSATDIEKFRTIGEYKAEEEDEISFPEGVEVEVVTKSLIGWWLVRYDGKEGVAPATFLKKIEEEEKAPKQEEVREPTVINFCKQQQVPRQKTVRRKASSKQLNLASLVSGLSNVVSQPVITEETEESSQRSQPSDAVLAEDDNFGGKPFRKQSDPRLLGDDANELSPSMPRRPRPTQIRKAISTPNTGLAKPSPERERSPSPKPKPQPRKRNQDSHAETDDETTSAATTTAAAQLVQATLNYVLVTKDPGLVTALKNAIAESPELRQLLKD